METALLDIQELSLSYSTLSSIRMESEYKLLDKLNLTIYKGKVTALIGGNGSGKTTIFNIISGFLAPDSGQIIYNKNKGVNLLKVKPHIRERIGIGRLFQDNHIFPELSILENLIIADSSNFGDSPFDSLIMRNKIRKIEKKRRERAIEALELCFGESDSIINKLDDYAKNLSFGQQRLLGLTRLIMGDYDILLLDEPTAGINATLISNIFNIISKLKKTGVTIFLIEHNMNFVRNVSDICAYISDGSIQYYDTPDKVLQSESVRLNYIGC